MSEIYPNERNQKNLFYVEFDMGESRNTFTIFQRHFFEKSEHPLIENEGHPWQLFDGFCASGRVPDQNFIKWMVDSMNKNIIK